MSYDEFGQQFLTEDELVEMIHINPELNLSTVLVENPRKFNQYNSALYAGYPTLKKYKKPACSVEEFDAANQANWHMPEKYKTFDIVTYLTDQCETDEQVNRVAEELALYDERNLIQLLQFLKYMIDTFREGNVLWGVGRGSCCASYVLFLLKVHRVDSLKFQLDIGEFLR